MVKSDEVRMNENMKQRHPNREDEKQLERRKGAKNNKMGYSRTLIKSVTQEVDLSSLEAQSGAVPS